MFLTHCRQWVWNGDVAACSWTCQCFGGRVKQSRLVLWFPKFTAISSTKGLSQEERCPNGNLRFIKHGKSRLAIFTAFRASQEQQGLCSIKVGCWTVWSLEQLVHLSCSPSYSRQVCRSLLAQISISPEHSASAEEAQPFPRSWGDTKTPLRNIQRLEVWAEDWRFWA